MGPKSPAVGSMAGREAARIALHGENIAAAEPRTVTEPVAYARDSQNPIQSTMSKIVVAIA